MSFDPGHTGALLRKLVAERAGAGLVGYWPVGYPDVAKSHDFFRAICGSADQLGADIVEIGIPYSDPMMDGPAIQQAASQALAGGVRTADVFGAVETVATQGKAPVVMTYWNLIEQYGVDAFARDLAAAGGQGVVTPDLTPDEAQEWLSASDAYALDRIFLLAPSSSRERIAQTLAACRGWVYATAVMGVTGAREQVGDSAPALVSRIRASDPESVAGVGIGVSTRAQAANIAEFADAVIVGSALVQCSFDVDHDQALRAVRDLATELAYGVGAAS